MSEDNELMSIYEWVDSVPLSRPKKNIARDFCDAGKSRNKLVMMAELIKFHLPRLVEIHNYSAASSTQQKLYNWNTLNKKVLKKLGIQLSKKEIDAIINYEQMAVESVLKVIYRKVINLIIQIQEYKINDGNVTSTRNDSMMQMASNSGNVGKNKPSNYLRDLNDNSDNNQLEYLKKQIDEHQNIIEHLKMSIDVKYFLKKAFRNEIQKQRRNRE